MATEHLIVQYDKHEEPSKVFYYQTVGSAVEKTTDEKYFYFSAWLGNDNNSATMLSPVKTFAKCLEIAKAYTGPEKYIHIIDLDEIFFSTSEDEIVFVDTAAGSDSNTGLTLNSPIQSHTKLNSVLQSSKRKIVMFLDTNVTDVSGHVHYTLNIPNESVYFFQARRPLDLVYADILLYYTVTASVANNVTLLNQVTVGLPNETIVYYGYEHNNLYYSIDDNYNNLSTYRRRHLLVNIVSTGHSGYLDMSPSLVSGQRIKNCVFLEYYNRVFYELESPDVVRYGLKGSNSLTTVAGSPTYTQFPVLHVTERLYPNLPRYRLAGGTLSRLNKDFTWTQVVTSIPTNYQIIGQDAQRIYLGRQASGGHDILIYRFVSEISCYLEFSFFVPNSNYGHSSILRQRAICNVFEVGGKKYFEFAGTGIVYHSEQAYIVYDLEANSIVYESDIPMTAYFAITFNKSLKRICLLNTQNPAYFYFDPTINGFNLILDFTDFARKVMRSFPVARQGIDELFTGNCLQEKKIGNKEYYFGYDQYALYPNSISYPTNGSHKVYELLNPDLGIKKLSYNFANFNITRNYSNEPKYAGNATYKYCDISVNFSGTGSILFSELKTQSCYLNITPATKTLIFRDSELLLSYLTQVSLQATKLNFCYVENLAKTDLATIIQNSAVKSFSDAKVNAVNTYSETNKKTLSHVPNLNLVGTTRRRVMRKAHNDTVNSVLCFAGNAYFYENGIDGNLYDCYCYIPIIADKTVTYKRAFSLPINNVTMTHFLEFQPVEFKGENGALDYYVDSDLVYEGLKVTTQSFVLDDLLNYIDLVKMPNKEVRLLFDSEESYANLTILSNASVGSPQVQINNAVPGDILLIGQTYYIVMYLTSTNYAVLHKPLETALNTGQQIKRVRLNSGGEYIFIAEPFEYGRIMPLDRKYYSNITFTFKRKL